jgi:serine/threonine protein kinase
MATIRNGARRNVGNAITLYQRLSSGFVSPNRQVRVEPLKPADPAELGGIELGGRLGRGGMGVVFYGVTPDGEQVAVKMIREELLERSEARGRFEREGLAIGMVQGPRVASLVASSLPDEFPPWFAVEYIRGLTLTEYVAQRGPLPTDLAAALGIGLTEALTAIHEAGILHRDLKPSNIILGKDGPKVIDFGLAALTAAPGDLTHTSETIGTPVCMAPEQVTSAKDLTTAADIYSLGAVLVFALTTHYPYERPTVPATLHAIADAATLPDLAGVPENLVGLVADMLAHAPSARPVLSKVTATLTEVLDARGSADPADRLQRLAEVTYRERPTDPPPADPPRAWRPRLPKNPRVPSVLVQQVANDLRLGYASSAPF